MSMRVVSGGAIERGDQNLLPRPRDVCGGEGWGEGDELIWLGVSLDASFPFWDGWPDSLSVWEWLCGLLIVPEPVFIALAVIFWFREQPRTVTEFHPNPDHDLRNLYSAGVAFLLPLGIDLIVPPFNG